MRKTRRRSLRLMPPARPAIECYFLRKFVVIGQGGNFRWLELGLGCTYNARLLDKIKISISSEELFTWVEVISAANAEKSAEALRVKLAKIQSSWGRREKPRELPPKRTLKGHCKTKYAHRARECSMRIFVERKKKPAANGLTAGYYGKERENWCCLLRANETMNRF